MTAKRGGCVAGARQHTGLGIGAWLAACAAAGLIVSWGGPAHAAESEDAPQILSSDLGPTTEVQTSQLTATFVVIGQHPIKSVTINGEAQTFAPGDTVQVTKAFELARGATTISVRAEDDKGNVRERSYLVGFGAAPVVSKWEVAGSGELRYERDENPTNDVGLPFTVSGIDVKGVIPASQRPDNRETVSANLIGMNGPLSVFGGGLRQQYDKTVNKGLNTTLLYGGAGYRFKMAETTDFVTNLVYSNLGVGDADYATLATVSGAFEFRSTDSKYNRRHLLEADITNKDFKSSGQTDGTIEIFKWDYLRTTPASMSTYNSLLQAGNATEGSKESDYNFFGMDFDWRNRWDSGIRFDIGFGYQYRDFPNDKQPITTALGATRVDHLLRASTGLGWQFNPRWATMLEYRYLTDLSNKSPYVRPIYGLSVTGGF